MKVTKLVTNPIHAGSLLLTEEVTVVEDLSESDKRALLEYEAENSVRLEDEDSSPVVTHKIVEAEGVVEERPKRAPRKKRASDSEDSE